MVLFPYLDSFFLSKNEQQTYAEAPSHLFCADLMISGANVLRWLPLGAICSKKASPNKHRNISSKLILKRLSEIAVVYEKSNITQNNLFRSQHVIDPIAIKAADYQLKFMKMVRQSVKLTTIHTETLIYIFMGPT